MSAKFDLNDSSVVVIVGSGAGGGTLANELAKKGISVVVLEAGKRMEMTEFQNDEIGMFGAFTWLDPRTSSGSWYVAKIVAGFARLDLQAGRRDHRSLGRLRAAISGTRIQDSHAVRRDRRRQFARLAH